MSFANFLTRNNNVLEPTFNVLNITNEPKELDDGARITDTIAYIGTGTYPTNTTQTITNNPNFVPLFQVSNRLNATLNEGIDINDLNLPSGIASPQNGGDYYTLNNPVVISPQIVKRGVYNVPLQVGGNGNILFNFKFGDFRSIILFNSFFFSLEDAQSVKFLNINGFNILVEFFSQINLGGTPSYVFKILEALEDDMIDDYLRIVSLRDSVFFQQLARLDYEVYVNSISANSFDYRLATYDACLNRVDAYETITYDPSNNPQDPPLLDFFGLHGECVLYSKNAVYVFMEVRVPVGSVQFEYKFASSKLETAVNTSVDDDILPPNEALNIFNPTYSQRVRDISGVDRDISILEADVAGLQTITLNQQGEITDLSNNKLSLSGGSLTGNLTLNNSTLLMNSSTLNMNGNKIEGLGLPVNQQDAVPLVYVEGILALTNSALNTKLDLSGGTMAGTLNMGSNKISNLQGGTSTEDAVNLGQLNQKLNLTGGTMTGIINMNGQKINNLQGGTANGDAVNLAQLNQKLSLSGGTMTSSINMGSNKIINLQNPTAGTDVANKQYVDSAIIGGLEFPVFSIATSGNLTPNIPSVVNSGSTFTATKTGTYLITMRLRLISGNTNNDVVFPYGSYVDAYLRQVGVSSNTPFFTTFSSYASLDSTDAGNIHDAVSSGLSLVKLTEGITYQIAYASKQKNGTLQFGITSAISCSALFLRD